MLPTTFYGNQKQPLKKWLKDYNAIGFVISFCGFHGTMRIRFEFGRECTVASVLFNQRIQTKGPPMDAGSPKLRMVS